MGVVSNSARKAGTWHVRGQMGVIPGPTKAGTWLISRNPARDNITLEFAGPRVAEAGIGGTSGLPALVATAVKGSSHSSLGKKSWKSGVALKILGKIHFGWREKRAVEWHYYICQSRKWMRRNCAARPMPRRSFGVRPAAEGIAELEARGIWRRRTLDSLCGRSVRGTSQTVIAKPEVRETGQAQATEILGLTELRRDSAFSCPVKPRSGAESAMVYRITRPVPAWLEGDWMTSEEVA